MRRQKTGQKRRKMKFLMLTSAVLIACVLCLASAKHHIPECKEDFPKMKAAAKEIIANGEAPACYEELGLDQFNSDGDEEEEKEMHKKMKDWIKEQDDDKKKAVKECMKAFGGRVFDKVKDDLSQECKDKMKEAKEKYLEAMGQKE